MENFDDGYTTFDGNGNAIWNYYKGFLKAYTNDYSTKRKLERVGGSQMMCKYFNPTGWDFVIPDRRRKTVERILIR